MSTGENYLINTICSDINSVGRNLLSIAISRKGEFKFEKVYRIIDSRWPISEAEEYTHWAYPYAVEYDQKLWVAFYMGKGGRILEWSRRTCCYTDRAVKVLIEFMYYNFLLD